MKKIVFASFNEGKINEMRALLSELKLVIVSAEQAGASTEVTEDGLTFADNALKKAREIMLQTNLPTIADDSGLCVDSLAGLPGIYSGRWAGKNASPEDLVNKLLSEMSLVSEKRRSAEFVSVVAFVWPDGNEAVFEGRVKGMITIDKQGTMRPNLPYDAVFMPIGHNQTYAEMSDDEKNSLSHRAEAYKKLKRYIENNLDNEYLV